MHTNFLKINKIAIRGSQHSRRLPYLYLLVFIPSSHFVLALVCVTNSIWQNYVPSKIRLYKSVA